MHFLLCQIIVLIIKQIPLSDIKKYSIDTFLIKICKNIRANRCKIAPSKEFRGYIASKKIYFHGLKLHMVASNRGYIREFLITPGSIRDIQGLYELPLNIEEIAFCMRIEDIMII